MRLKQQREQSPWRRQRSSKRVRGTRKRPNLSSATTCHWCEALLLGRIHDRYRRILHRVPWRSCCSRRSCYCDCCVEGLLSLWQQKKKKDEASLAVASPFGFGNRHGPSISSFIGRKIERSLPRLHRLGFCFAVLRRVTFKSQVCQRRRSTHDFDSLATSTHSRLREYL